MGGVQVFLVGAQLGAITRADGRYTIGNVPPGTYQVRSILMGYRPETRSVTVTSGSQIEVNIPMTRQTLVLEQIVVTGTAGGARQREVGNAVSVVDRSNAVDVPVNMETMLQAQSPGISVLQRSGQIGGAAQIRLRGTVSASMSNQPLLYIDGVRVRSEPYPNPSIVGRRSNNENQSPLNDINPEDIERIEIIKGAAATTLYGTEAAAGVIQIFTKRGSVAGTIWTTEYQHGLSQLQPFAPDPVPYFRLDPWLKNGKRQLGNISVQGGADALKYFASGSRESSTGVLPNETLGRTSIRGNFSFTPLRGLDLAWNTALMHSNISNVAGGVNPSSFIYNVMRWETNFVADTSNAAISRVLDQQFLSGIDRITTGVTATYVPLTNWTNRVTLGYDRSQNVLKQLRPYGFVLQTPGDLNVRDFRSEQTTVDLSSTLTANIRSNLTSNFSVGGQLVSNDELTIVGYSLNFPGPTDPTLSTGSQQQVSQTVLRVITGGFFAQEVVGWRDRVFVTAGMRVDGSSAFGSGFGLQTYPKISASWVISEEPFWRKGWGELKLRGAYGAAGRAPGAFDAIRTWNPIGFGTVPAYLPQNVGNPQLGPERTGERELGFDWSVLDGRLNTELTHFSRRTTAALFPVRQIPSLGFQSSQLENVGTIDDKGTELSVTWRALQRRNFSWTLNTSVATNHSKVVSLGGATPLSLGNSGWLLEGEPIAAMRGVYLLNPDELADPKVELNHVFGPNNPALIIGPGTTIELPGRIQLSARGEFQGRYYMLDGSSDAAASRSIASWPTCLAYNKMKKDGQADKTTAYDRLRCDSRFYQANIFINKGDFFKLRDVSARIPLPVRGAGVNGASLTLSAHNWYRWVNSDFPIFEPEVGAGAEPALQRVRATGEGQIPPPREFIATLRFIF
jgi:TonB-dependent SusC/RagA subfamily outer membrane receptor